MPIWGEDRPPKKPKDTWWSRNCATVALLAAAVLTCLVEIAANR